MSARKKIGWIAALSLPILFVLFSYRYHHSTALGSHGTGYPSTKNAWTLDLMITGLNTLHFKPQELNDSFSVRVFNLYMKRLDYSKKFLVQEDVNQLTRYKYKIDDQVKDRDFEFFDLSVSIFNKRLHQVEQYYQDILAQPFNLEENDSLETDPDKLKYPLNDSELKEAWKKAMKYQVMIKVAELMDEQEKLQEKKDTVVEVKTLVQLEADARQKVLKSNKDYFRRLNKITVKDRYNLYLTSIANTYDPHTDYLAPKEKKSFDISMTGQLQGIGAQLQEKDGAIKVNMIMPGSASFRQGQLKAGDVILKVAQGKGEAVDVTNMPLDDVVELIRGKKGTEVRLTVKKPDASIVVIPIIRDIVLIEETFAQSAILTKNNKKIGYLHLPSFYYGDAGNAGRTSAEDVRAELEKLTGEKIDGLIFDLRDNGGGSLADVVKMTGLFIGKGPVVQRKTQSSPVEVMNTQEMHTLADTSIKVYKGPMVVLVNNNSASASEILAAALQDYNRAIIVGNNTFGKGTVQQFIDLDAHLPKALDSLRSLGAVKLTIQKFYRVNGGSTQLKGVKPDIELPDMYKFVEEGEKDLDYALPWDEIAKANYKPMTKSFDINGLAAKSSQRIKSSPSFKLVEERAQDFKSDKEHSVEPLNINAYRAKLKREKEEDKKYEEWKKEIPDLTSASTLIDAKVLGSDTAKVNKQKNWLKNIRKDIYIDEASNIIGDMK